MDLKRIYDYMTGRPETYKGLKDVGYDDFEKSMGDARYRRGVYNQLYINGGINSKYDVFEGSWQKTYGEPAVGAGETGVVNGDVEPVLDINSTRILGAEDFERYEAEQKPSSTMDTYDYEKMRVDPEKERQRLDAFRGELEEEGVNPESVYAAIDAGEKEIEKGWQEAQKRRDEERREDSRVPVGPNFARVEGMYEDTPAARDLSNFSLAKDLYDDARNLLDASFKGSGFGRGVWDAVYDVDALTAGLTELGKNVQLNRVYEKAKKGEELTASEARLLDAANYYTLAGALQQASLPSTWYRWGKGFGGSVPYMLEFALTYGPASSVTKGLARAVFKKLGGGTVGRVAGESAEALTTAAVQTPLNATNVASGTYRRMMGKAEVAEDENGVPVFIGMTDKKSLGQALGEATGAQYIENLSEVSGRMLSGAGHLIKRTAPRYVQKGLEKIADNRYVRAMADNAFTRGLRKVGKRFKIGNAPEEIHEEYFGGVLNGLLIGDTDLESLFSMQSFVEITGTAAVTQVFLGAVGASMNHRSKRSLVKRYEKAEREYDALFSSPEERDMYVSYVNLNLNGVQGKGGKPMLTVLREAVEKMVNSHGDNFVRADGTFDTEAAKAYREKVSRVFGNYFVAKQLYDSYMAGIRTRKEADRERIATEMQEKAVNGQIMTVTLADGRRARVVSGDIVVDGDGRIDVGRSGDHFTAVYEDDGSTVQLPVEDSYTVEVVSVEDAVEAASRANDEIINREEEEAVYGPRPKLGETVTMLDSEGNRVQLVVSGEVDESGNFMAMPMEDFDNNVKGMAVAVNMSQIVRDDAASEGVDGANEFQSFVNEGTVSDATVERIAGKIANGESLTAEEEAMRQGANERVEGALAKLRDMEGEKQGESALSRIEKDAKGQPLHEKADVETAWDALVEQSEGDESIARDVAASMVKDKEAALKKMEKAPAKGATPAEKTADAKVRKENIDKARAELEHWQAIAGVSQSRADGQTEGNAVQSETPQVAGDVAENPVGRSLNAEEADMLISQMEQSAEVAPEMELTIENWDSEFGADGRVKTPIGEVKMGENQFTKLMRQGRSGKLGMVKPTLENPDIIIEDSSKAKDEEETERGSSYVYVKTFVKPDGSRYYYFTSVTVSRDGKEVVISNQEKRKSVLTNLLLKGKLVWKHADDVSTASDVADGLYSSQGNLSDPITEGTDAPQTNNSTSESIERIGEKQGKSEENTVISSEEDIDVTVGRVMEIPDAGDRSALVSGLLASAKAEEKSVSRVKNKVDPRNTQAFLAEQQRIRGEQDKARAEVAYWEEVKRIVEESNAAESAPAEPSKVKAARPKSIRERISALGEVLNLRDYILRALATGEYKFIWGDNRNGTKGLGSHLGFGNNRRGIEERQRRIWLLNNEEGLYPEQVAELLYANIQAEYPYLAQDDVEVFNEMLDVLRYDSAKDMVSEAEDMRRRREEMYEEYDSDQAMYDATMQERDERVDAENEAYRRELESQESGTPAEGRAAEPLGDTVADAEAEVNTNPTEKQKEAEYSSIKTISGESGDAVTDNLMPNTETTAIQGFDGYSQSEIKSIVQEYIQQKLDENDISANVVGIAIHGSRGRGNAKENSDLDVVVEYEGDIREDGMFNLLNDDDNGEALYIEGIRVDINPIRAQETGTLDKYMERSRKYDEEVLSNDSVEDSTVRYRRGEDGVQGVRRTQESEMEREVRGFGERMANRLGGGVRLVYSDEIADSEAHAEEKRRSKGYYDTATGEVVVVLDNNTVKGVPSVIEVAMTMMHEVVGHKGVRGLFGTKEDAFLDDVYRGMKARTKAEMESLYGGQLGRREGESEEAFEARRRRLLADEYIARVAEEGNNPGLLRRVGAKVRGLLRGLGVELAITDNEIRDILRRSARELTRRKDGAMNVREDGGVRYRQSVNERFNEELKRYERGEMGNNEMFHLGNPQGVMRIFLPNLPIVMRQRVIKKGTAKKHNVSLQAINDMPSMISEPIFVFQRDADTIGILTDMLDADGKNVCVAIELGKTIQDGKEYLEVNDIRSFHGREVKYIVEPIVYNNTLRYADKEKGLAWLSSASQPVQQEIDKQDLLSATNIVKEFENPTVGGENVRYRRGGEEETEFSKKYNLNEEDVSNYAYHMSMGNLGGATRAFHEIRRKVRIDNDGTSLGRFTKIFTPIKRELYSRFGNIDELRDSIERTNEEARKEMESVRKKAEEEAEAERRRIAVFQRMTDEQLDEEYMKAVSEKDESRLRDLVNEAARRNGYGDIDSEYQGVGAWSAPANPGYENSEIRHASYEREGGAVNVLDIEQGYSPQPDNYFTNLRVYGNDTPHGRESASAIYRSIQSIKSGKKPKIKVYRAVPSTVKEGKLRNGDWVTPSKKYAEMHGNHRLEGDYRIIEQEVSAEDLWWDGNDINEWGYDDGNSYTYRNTKNNRKLYELITRDDEGRIIPLSERFNSRREDVRYRLTEEEQGIVEEAKRDGSYMKAPNGAPTRLTEKQWAGVRTKAFKAWFGDWEKAARIEKLRKSEPVEISGEEITPSDDLKQYKKNAPEYGKRLQGEYTNKDTGRVIQLQRGRKNGGLKEVLQHDINDAAHIQSVAAIPQIIENAVYIDSAENRDVNKNPQVAKYHYYVCGLKIGGEDYTVRMVEAEEKDGSRYYDHKLTHIEKGKLIDELALLNLSSSTELSSTPGTGTGERNRPTNRGETQTVPVSDVKDKQLLSLLQTNSSKVVDENGEPTIFEPTGEVDKSNGDEESGVLYRKVTDMDTLKRLEEEPTIKVYRAMANIDGKLYPPMSTKIDGKLRAPIELGVWEEAEERPDLVDEKGNFKLKKDNGTTVPARYNPYIHTSRTPLNDQFSSAYKRPNLVTVEVEVPVSELTSGYHAEKAKDSVGEKSWHAGPVSGKLPTGKKRKVILSRWDKPIRIVPDEEVAKKISEILDGENIPIPYNVITPSLRKELEKLGVLIKDVGRDDTRYRIAEEDYASVQDDASGEYAEALSAPMDISVADMMPIEAAENAQAAGLLRDVVNRFPDTKIAITDLSRVYAAAEVAEEEATEVRYRREVNERFNEELERQIAGELPKGHVYSLGRPSEVLLAAGIPDLPIELAASRLSDKSMQDNHPYDLSEVKDLPQSIQAPMAVFRSATHIGSFVVMTEIEHRGRNFVVAIEANRKKGRIEINDIRSIHYRRTNAHIANWIAEGLLEYADKKRVAEWFSKQRYNSAEVRKLFNHAANIVKEFENPAVDGENVRYRRGISFDTRGASHRDTDITGRRERSFGEKASRLKEKAGISLYDEQLKLKQLQGKVAEWLTGSRKGALDDRLLFYEAENQAGSIAMDRKVRFDNEYRERLFALRAEVFKALGNKVDDKYYFYAKTLNERTGVIGEKEMAANKATMFSHLLSEQHPGHRSPKGFPKGFFDPKTYGYEALQAYARKEGWIDSIEGYIADCESRMGEKLVKDIWGVIGEIAEYQLTTSMKKGLISRDHFDRLMYVRPLAELVRENLEKGLITEGQYRAFLATDFTADELVKAGFITREQREGLKRRYEYYLPLKGDSEPTTEEVADYERSRIRVSWQIKSVNGGNTRLVNDPVSRLLADVYASISYQEKMAWIQSMYHALRLAERQGKGAGDFAILDNWVVKDETGDYVPYVRYVEGEPVFAPTEQEIAKGEVERARNLPIETAIRVPEAVQGEHIVKLKHRGRTIHIYFRDPAVANAVNNHFVPRVSPGWLKWAHAINRFRASVYTSYNPEFVFSNLFKDFGEAAVNNYVQYGATYLKEFTKNYGRVMRHAGTTLRGAKRKLVPTNDYERRVEEFFKYGGEVSYTQIESYEKAIRDFEKELKRSADKRGVVSVTKAGFVKIGKAVSAANKLAELNARLATFITSRERGYGLRQSIRDAKEVTVNFDRRGRDSRYFGAWFLFWNAGRQSNRRKLELFLEHPGRFIKSRAVIWTVAIAKPFLLGTIMSSLFGIDWEDYMTRYFDLPDFIRYNNIVFLTADGKVYRMPLSPSFRPDMTLAENFAELIYRKVFNDKDGKYDVVKGSADILKSLSADLGDPTRWDADGKGKLVGWAPAPIMASAELLGNTDFTGRPIYKKGNTASPGYKNVYSGTNSFYVGTGKWLNRVSGGEEAYGSWLGRNVNPAVVEHYVDSWLGGLGNFAVKIYGMVKSGIDVLGGASDTFMDGRYEQIPFVGKLYAGDAEMLGEREVRDDIYDARRLVESYNDVRSNFRKTDEDYENNPKTSQYLENNEYRIDELKDLLKKYDEVTEELKSEDSEAYRRELRLLRRSIVELTNEMEEY